MALSLRRLSKFSMLAGGALVVAALILGIAASTSGTAPVSAQASPTARPATATVVATVAATPVRTATPAAPAGAATAVRTATPAAPNALPANGDSMTFPAVLIALLGAGLIGLGLTARYTFGKSRA